MAYINPCKTEAIKVYTAYGFQKECNSCPYEQECKRKTKEKYAEQDKSARFILQQDIAYQNSLKY